MSKRKHRNKLAMGKLLVRLAKSSRGMRQCYADPKILRRMKRYGLVRLVRHCTPASWSNYAPTSHTWLVPSADGLEAIATGEIPMLPRTEKPRTRYFGARGK